MITGMADDFAAPQVGDGAGKVESTFQPPLYVASDSSLPVHLLVLLVDSLR